MAVAGAASRKLLQGAGGAFTTGVVAANAIGMSFGLDGLWQFIVGLFGSAIHLLLLPFEALWHWLQTDVASAAHQFVLPFEALWRWLQTAAAHGLVVPIEALRRLLQAAFPFLLLIAAVLCLAALVWYCWGLLCAAGVAIGQALVLLVCFTGHGLYLVAVRVGGMLACCLPGCGHCCVAVTMNAPGAAGFLISRAAFVANPQLYFQILRSAGAAVVSAVFCIPTVASVVAAPVAALFRA